MWNHKIPQITKVILRIPDSTRYYKTVVMKTVWYWKKIDIDRWNRTDSLEINLCLNGQLFCDKGGKNMRWKKSLTNGAGKMG